VRGAFQKKKKKKKKQLPRNQQQQPLGFEVRDIVFKFPLFTLDSFYS
jgi:hypothetical protein